MNQVPVVIREHPNSLITSQIARGGRDREEDRKKEGEGKGRKERKEREGMRARNTRYNDTD